MKKCFFGLLISILFLSSVEAFSIDVSKITIHNKSNELISTLDGSYSIDASDFENNVIYDEKAQELARTLIGITASKKDTQDKIKEMNQYLFISKSNGFDTLTGSIFMQNYLKDIDEYDIEYSYIKSIRTVSFMDDVMGFVYVPDCTINGEKKDILFSYWMKNDNGEYKIYYPWFSIDDDLDEYFEKITNKENNKQVLGETYNKISINEESVSVSEEVLASIYEKSNSSVVQVTSMLDTGNNSYGSGFFIRKGVIVTSWSLFQEYLNNGNLLYVNDSSGNTYEIDGVISADTDYGVVVLKLTQEIGEPVRFKKTSELSSGVKIFTISSKINSGFSINYGSFVTLENGKLEDLFAISSSDVGGAVFDKDGYVVGFHTNEVLNSDLSYAHSTDYLIHLKSILEKNDFNKIKVSDIDTFKNKYYTNISTEKEYNNIPDKIWNEYKSIGKLEENITLPLIKGSYKDKIVSLRYRNNISNLIQTMYFISDYSLELEESGYQLTYSDSVKKIYNNGKYKVVVKEDLNYLIILIMEV